MVKRILTPVDAGEPSEAIVPVVAALARDAGSTIRLLRVLPIPTQVIGNHGRIVAYADQEMERLTNEGLADLQRLEALLSGVPVESVVRFGEPVEEIVREAEAFDADLIALGASPASRVQSTFAPGVAERVARAAPIPTLTLRH